MADENQRDWGDILDGISRAGEIVAAGAEIVDIFSGGSDPAAEANQYNQDLYEYGNEQQRISVSIDHRNLLVGATSNYMDGIRGDQWDYGTRFNEWKLSDNQAKHDAEIRQIAHDTEFANRYAAWEASEDTRLFQRERERLVFMVQEVGRKAAYRNVVTEAQLQDERDRAGVNARNWQTRQRHRDQLHSVNLAEEDEDLRYKSQNLHNQTIREVASFRHNAAIGEIGAAMIAEQVKATRGSEQARKQALAEGSAILAAGQTGATVQKMLITAMQSKLAAEHQAEQAHSSIAASTKIATASQRVKLKEELMSQRYTAKRRFFAPAMGPLEAHIRAPQMPPMARRAGPAEFVATHEPLKGVDPMGYIRAPKPLPGPQRNFPTLPEPPFHLTPPRPPGSSGGSRNGFLETIGKAAHAAVKIADLKDQIEFGAR